MIHKPPTYKQNDTKIPKNTLIPTMDKRGWLSRAERGRIENNERYGFCYATQPSLAQARSLKERAKLGIFILI
jgi:hypothetical protein